MSIFLFKFVNIILFTLVNFVVFLLYIQFFIISSYFLYISYVFFLFKCRADLKKAFRKMCVTICGRFCSDEGVVVDYDNRIRTKYTAKWGVQIAGMIFQIHSSIACRYAAKQWNPVSFCMNFVMIHYCSLKTSDSKIRERKNFWQKSCK